MRIAVPRETAPGERRVALVPESCKKLIQAGYEIAIEAGAGEAAGFADEAYREVGVAIEADPAAPARLGRPRPRRSTPPRSRAAGRDEVAWMRPGAIYLGSLMPLRNLDAVPRAGGAQDHRLRDRRHPAHHPRAVDGHAVVDGEHRRATRACCSPPSS